MVEELEVSVKSALSKTETQLQVLARDLSSFGTAVESLQSFGRDLGALVLSLRPLEKAKSELAALVSHIAVPAVASKKNIVDFFRLWTPAQALMEKIRVGMDAARKQHQILVGRAQLTDAMKRSLVSREDPKNAEELLRLQTELRMGRTENEILTRTKRKLEAQSSALRWRLEDVTEHPEKFPAKKVLPAPAAEKKIVVSPKEEMMRDTDETFAFPVRTQIVKMKSGINTLIVYDIAGKTCKLLPYGTKLPRDFDLAVTASHVFLCGGRTIISEFRTHIHNQMWELSPPKPGLMKRRDMKSKRCLHRLVAISDSQMYAIGGLYDAPQSSCELYHVEDNTWTPAPSLNSARYNFAACRMAPHWVYIFGGTSGAKGEDIETSVERLSCEEGKGWESVVVPEGSGAVSARCCNFQIEKDKILIVGGKEGDWLFDADKKSLEKMAPALKEEFDRSPVTYFGGMAWTVGERSTVCAYNYRTRKWESSTKLAIPI